GIAEEFDTRAARKKLRQLRRRGPDRTTRLLIEGVRGALGAVRGAVLLDVGGGVGAIPEALLAGAVERAVYVDASPASVAVAREEAGRTGLAARMEFVQGDFVDQAGEIPPADVVTLDRVICCYPDMRRLVALSAARARAVYGAVYPRQAWWTRAMLAAANAFLRAKRSDFRVFLHPPAEIDRSLGDAGFGLPDRRLTLFWIVAIYRRETGADAPPG
ncbi:MAG TPA: class I SAM-dependent methyltransferase, partial [Gemmatimonadaceae bacterium]|nr:class I SAM-dependent methyltransferase [Gemmatimonadaceae bacterium]